MEYTIILKRNIDGECQKDAIEKFEYELKNDLYDKNAIEISLASYREFSGGWCLEDIKHQAKENGYNLTDQELNDVADLCESEHDASIGINWDVIDYHVDRVVEERN